MVESGIFHWFLRVCSRGLENNSLREAAKFQAPWNSFTKNRCTCKSGRCNTKRCSCVRNNIECSNHCHHGSICDNKKGNIINDLKTKGAECI